MAKRPSFAEWQQHREELVAGKSGLSTLLIANHGALVGWYVFPSGASRLGGALIKTPREIEAARRYVCEQLASLMSADGYDVTASDVMADPAWRSNSGNPLLLDFRFDPAEPTGVAAVVAALRSYFEEATK